MYLSPTLLRKMQCRHTGSDSNLSIVWLLLLQVPGGGVGGAEGLTTQLWKGGDEGLQPSSASAGQLQRLRRLRLAVCGKLL